MTKKARMTNEKALRVFARRALSLFERYGNNFLDLLIENSPAEFILLAGYEEPALLKRKLAELGPSWAERSQAPGNSIDADISSITENGIVAWMAGARRRPN